MVRWTLAGLALSLVVACGGTEEPDDPQGNGLPGVALLGGGSGSADAVEVTVIQEDLLDTPRDLAFNPLEPHQLWVVNQGTQSATVIFDPGTADQTAEHFRDTFSGTHFLARPSSLAFGENGNFATAHDTDEKTQGENGTPADFMGPTLWTGDVEIFDGGHGSHLDMLHNSPLGKGIAWEADNSHGNTYWVFDGYHSSVTRYDFQTDHDLGGADHSDGIIARYAEGEVKAVDSAPSHLWFDNDTGLLYIADSGNSRIAVLDTHAGDRGEDTRPNYDGCDQFEVVGTELTTLVDGDEVNLGRPSGLTVHEDVMYVSDASTSTLFAFDLDGNMLDWVHLPDFEINGVEISPEGDALFFVDPTGKVVRVRAK